MAYSETGAIAPLMRGETVEVRGVGNSMTPILRSGEVVTVAPVSPDTALRKGDIVIAKVHGHVYLHLVHGVRGAGTPSEQIQIGNNHGHMNGWTPRHQVFGRLLR